MQQFFRRFAVPAITLAVTLAAVICLSADNPKTGQSPNNDELLGAARQTYEMTLERSEERRVGKECRL